MLLSLPALSEKIPYVHESSGNYKLLLRFALGMLHCGMIQEQDVQHLVTVSMDGGAIPLFPDAKPDNGISWLASSGNGINTVPAIFLIDRQTQQTIPLGTGIVAGEELAERIRVLTLTTPGQEF